MSNKIKSMLVALALVPVLSLSGGVAFAANDTATDLTIGNGAIGAKGTSQSDDLNATFKQIANILLFVIGAVSVVMLIIGGIRYTISQGDSAAITSAKNTILYAIIGLVVAILAFAIVNFVLAGLGFGADATTS